MATKAQSVTGNSSDALAAALMPLARTMIKGGFGAGELVRAAKMAYVKAALREVVPEGKKVNVSRLSVATGMTRKEIAVLLREINANAPPRRAKKTMEQRALRVLRGWIGDPAYQKANGRPAELELGGDDATFSSLVKLYGGDVTPTTVLRELERMDAAGITKSGKVRLHSQALESRTHAAHQMVDLARLLKDFSSAAQQAISPQETRLFFGFRDSSVASVNHAALFQRIFSQRAAALLESIDQWAAKTKRQTKGGSRSAEGAVRVGLGVYLVQDEP